VAKRLKRVLIITDRTLVAKFLRGLLSIIQKHLVAITKDISELFVEFDAIFVSRISSHKNISIENDVADALCTWSIEHPAPFTHFSDLHLFEGDTAVPSIRNARLAIQHRCSTMPSLVHNVTRYRVGCVWSLGLTRLDRVSDSGQTVFDTVTAVASDSGPEDPTVSHAY
jgi:hypothetical protein